MKILVEKFCSIATDGLWLSWLHDYDTEFYNEYISDLKITSGCSGKKDLVVKTLEKIDSRNHGYKLLEFINNNYPNMVVKDSSTRSDLVFPDYKPGILSYPRRIIISSNELDDFVSDKLLYEYVIVDGVAYIEYLLDSDKNLVDGIPDENWLVREFKNNQK